MNVDGRIKIEGYSHSPFQSFQTLAASQNTGQSISSLAKVPIEILSGYCHITWVLAVLLFSIEFQMEPLVPYVILYYTSQEPVLD